MLYPAEREVLQQTFHNISQHFTLYRKALLNRLFYAVSFHFLSLRFTKIVRY